MKNRIPLFLILSKIIFTIFFLVVPLTFFPDFLLAHFGIFPEDNVIFLRLLGVSYLSLVFVYWGVYRNLQRERFLAAGILAGAMSNGLSLAVLAVFSPYLFSLPLLGKIYFGTTMLFLGIFTGNFLYLLSLSRKTNPAENQTNRIVRFQPDVRWQVVFRDPGQWKTGIYVPEYTNAESIPEMEKHNGPELFIAQKGKCGLVLCGEDGKEYILTLESGEAVLVEGHHNGFRIDPEAYFLVVEKDPIQTIMTDKEKICTP